MNIYDIAKEAGVSISTVSRVLNNKSYVKQETREKIETVLKKYSYTPSAIARGLVTKSMNTIGILTVDIRVPHYAKTAYIIEQEFSNNGYNVIVCNTDGSMDKNNRYIKILNEKKVDGLVLIGSVFNEIMSNDEILENLKDIPIILANGRLDISNAYSVLVDDKMGIKLAVDYLYSKGHRNILYVEDLESSSAVLKQSGFISSMKKHDVKNPNKFIFKTEYGLDGGKAIAKKILELGIKFSAVVFGEDLTAIGAMKEFKRAGLKIPDDVAITGFNNSEYALLCEPELTSVENNAETMGVLVAKMLKSLIEEDGKNASLMIQPELVVRGSTQ